MRTMLSCSTPTSSPVTLNNYSIQYGSASGTTISTVTNLPATLTIAAGGYYIIACDARYWAAGAALPVAADFSSGTGTGAIAFAAGAGKIALVNTTTKLASACVLTDPTMCGFCGLWKRDGVYSAPSFGPGHWQRR